MNKPEREGFVADQPVDDVVDIPTAPPEPAAPEPPREEWPIRIKLRKPIRDNKGVERVKAGEAFPLTELRKMDWLVEGVIGQPR